MVKILLFLLLSAMESLAATLDSEAFQSSMIIQGEPKRANFFGQCNQGEQFTLKVCKNNCIECESTLNVNCNQQTEWKGQFVNPIKKTALGEFVNICIGETVAVSRVAIGDVWLIMGQSNIGLSNTFQSGNAQDGYETYSFPAYENKIYMGHIYRSEYAWDTPRSKYSGTNAFLFLKALFDTNQSGPIGGMLVHQPGAAIGQFLNKEGNLWSRFLKASKMTYRGIYFWQGEQDRANAAWGERLKELITNWRMALQDGDIPVVYMGFPIGWSAATKPRNIRLNQVQQDKADQLFTRIKILSGAQFSLFFESFIKSTPSFNNVFMVPTHRIERGVGGVTGGVGYKGPESIHPKHRVEIAKHAAIAAIQATKGGPLIMYGPVPSGIKRATPDCVDVSYREDSIGEFLSQLYAKDKNNEIATLRGFFVSTAETCDGKLPFVNKRTCSYVKPTSQQILADRKGVRICNSEGQIKEVMYAWETENAYANLANSYGIPAVPFVSYINLTGSNNDLRVLTIEE